MGRMPIKISSNQLKIHSNTSSSISSSHKSSNCSPLAMLLNNFNRNSRNLYFRML